MISKLNAGIKSTLLGFSCCLFFLTAVLTIVIRFVVSSLGHFHKVININVISSQAITVCISMELDGRTLLILFNLTMGAISDQMGRLKANVTTATLGIQTCQTMRQVLLHVSKAHRGHSSCNHVICVLFLYK